MCLINCCFKASASFLIMFVKVPLDLFKLFLTHFAASIAFLAPVWLKYIFSAGLISGEDLNWSFENTMSWAILSKASFGFTCLIKYKLAAALPVLSSCGYFCFLVDIGWVINSCTCLSSSCVKSTDVSWSGYSFI